ncbi:hypothetical protein HYH70_00055 [Clostridium botulinum]|uniref:hypothetical protein n=1 Tax=Clostridium botulinum TaxID=1491 RepID=UPI0006A7325E|nr:hypothetical protein [Clostridium botulinum]KON10804.1 hypothetical protein ACP52_01500 [Clostridium botulinum]MBY6904008.1 hypothetical protein [Clostridium botulinum]MBY6925462.1 hypothetical protein [Clostridium botulinum]MBY6953385.1 hypothetical protein [Clostridium botulinum]NFH08762.1 hypothetical protein [Clostridium botulinum]
MFFNKKKVYTFEEGLKAIKKTNETKIEKLSCTMVKKLNNEGVYLKEGDKLYNTLAFTLGGLMYVEKVIAVPKTGVPKLDQGGWKMVGVAQSVIFWASMIYAFKALLELAVKGEGTWKKVGTGFLICIMNYLIPEGFQLIRSIFM